LPAASSPCRNDLVVPGHSTVFGHVCSVIRSILADPNDVHSAPKATGHVLSRPLVGSLATVKRWEHRALAEAIKSSGISDTRRF
jgi:hypothetical protein